VSRLKDVGMLSKEAAIATCAVGPMARASGLALDYRLADTAGAYQELNFEPVISNDL
jgi:Ni,Fe-hydrogenase III large subunit